MVFLKGAAEGGSETDGQGYGAQTEEGEGEVGEKRWSGRDSGETHLSVLQSFCTAYECRKERLLVARRSHAH